MKIKLEIEISSNSWTESFHKDNCKITPISLTKLQIIYTQDFN